MRRFIPRPAADCGEVLRTWPATPYWRCQPRIAGPRAGWMAADVWRHFYAPAVPPAACVVRLRNATLRGPGVITLDDDTLVAESLINTGHLARIAGLARAGEGFEAETGLAFPPATPGCAVLIKQMWDENYGHWLIESLPRAAACLGLPAAAGARVIVTGLAGMGAVAQPMAAVVAQSLQYFGVAGGRVWPVGWDPVCVETLIYPTPMTVQPWVKAPEAIALLEALGARVARRGGARRLFVRRMPHRRRLLNAAAVEALFVSRGFTPVAPWTADFNGQVDMFANATEVVGVLGAECANLVFAPRGVRFFGLAPASMQDDFFWDLVSLKEGGYACLHGAGEEDFTVDVDVLSEESKRFFF